MSTVSASDFKAHCLQYMDTVQRKHTTYVITKHGEPVAKLVPYQEHIPPLYGHMEGTGIICADILEPMDIEWEAYKE